MRKRLVVMFTLAFLQASDSIDLELTNANAAETPPIELPLVIVKEPPIGTPERLYTEKEAQEFIDRTPGGVALVSPETITNSLGTNFKDVLDFVPGVFVQPRQGGTSDESQFSIRGSGLRNNFHIRGINILQDGFILNNADGFFRPEVLEFAATKRIEVFKGANGLRFGSNTLGGAINLVTKTGTESGLVDLWSEGGSFGFFKNYLATGNVFGPFDLFGGFTYTRANGYRDHSEISLQRIFSNVGYQFVGGTNLRLDLGYVRNKQALPGALTLTEFKSDPRQAAPESLAQDERHDYHFNRAAFTVRTPLASNQALEWFTHYNYTDLDHPLAFAVIDNVDNNWSTEVRYLIDAPLFDHGNRFTTGLQYAGTRQIDYSFDNNGGQRGARIKNQINHATNVGVYFQNQFDLIPTFSLVAGGRVDYSHRAVDDRFLSNGDASDSVNFVSFTPKFGFIWKAMPTVQVFGNISRAYEPPLILELTAPGQINGDLSELKPQRAWQFELGTRGDIGDRFAWTFAVYDIELRDEIQNVNVQPFPFAPFTIPRFQNIRRSRHSGVEVGFNALLAKSFVQPDDALRLNTAYTYSNFVFVNDPTFNNKISRERRPTISRPRFATITPGASGLGRGWNRPRQVTSSTVKTRPRLPPTPSLTSAPATPTNHGTASSFFKLGIWPTRVMSPLWWWMTPMDDTTSQETVAAFTAECGGSGNPIVSRKGEIHETKSATTFSHLWFFYLFHSRSCLCARRLDRSSRHC